MASWKFAEGPNAVRKSGMRLTTRQVWKPSDTAMDSTARPGGVKLRKGRVDPVARVQQVGVRVDGGVEAADEHVAVVLAAGEQAQSAAVHEQLRPEAG